MNAGRLMRHAVSVLFVPVAWVRALWAARVLLHGQWSRYMGFRPKNALNSLFYRTQWLNLDRYGRNGISPVLGLGAYPLARWFHVTRVSNYLYAHAGAVVMLGGTLAWAASHIVWLGSADAGWIATVTVTLFVSSTAYVMAFVRQNYNVLGWLWLPVVLFGVLNNQWAIAALALLVASFGSVTVIAVAIPLVLITALGAGESMLAWVLAPAVLKLALHIKPLIQMGGLRTAVSSIGKLIGMFQVNIRYRRRTMRFDRFNLYFTVLYLGACGVLWFAQGTPPALPLTAALLFVMNQRFVRFADDQSVILLFVTAYAAHTLSTPAGLLEWALLFAVANPLPFLFGITDRDGRIDVYPPFDHTGILQRCDALFATVPDGSRILFAFDDPAGSYENLFDGYRIVVEPFQLTAVRRRIHLVPDWYAVSETNHPGARPIWGRSLPEVLDNLADWNTDFVLYYQPPADEFSAEWLARFDVIGRFDWTEVAGELVAAPPWGVGMPCPKFTLLKLKDP